MKLLHALLETSLYSAALLAIIQLIKFAFKKGLSPGLQYALWFVVIARLCLPFTIESGFHFIKIEQQAQTIAGEDLGTVGMAPAQPKPGATLGQGEQPSEPVNTPAPNSPFSLTTSAALLFVWVAGMAARLIALLFAQRRLRLAIAGGEREPGARAMGIYEICLRDLNMQKKPPLRVCCGISSPALTVGFHPAVVLPEYALAQLSDEQLFYTIRYELTHYKQRDHWVCRLLRLLEAVYWFNPVIWLTSRGIVKDMETACDSATTAALCPTGRREYALTLLKLFSRPISGAGALSMAGGNLEKDAERRVRGVFQGRKSPKAVRIAIGFLTAMMLLCCFTTACQPVTLPPAATPEASKNGLLAATGDILPIAYDREKLEGGTDAAATPEENELVCSIQQKLVDLGYLGLSVLRESEGVYNEATRDAVAQFQRDNDLTADGAVGKDTFQSLMAATSGIFPGELLLALAKDQVGKPYEIGASGPDAFDGEGLIRYVLEKAGAVQAFSLAEWERMEGFMQVRDIAALRQGDILLFKNEAGTMNHTGIFAGGGALIHASSSNGQVITSTFGSYFERHFYVALRSMSSLGEAWPRTLSDMSQEELQALAAKAVYFLPV